MKNKAIILIGLALSLTAIVVYLFSYAFYENQNEGISPHRVELKNELIAKSLNDKRESEDRKLSQVNLFEIMEKSDIPQVIKGLSPSLPLEEVIGIVDHCLSISQISTSYNLDNRGPDFIRKEVTEHVAKVIGNKDVFSLEWLDLDRKSELEMVIYATKYLGDCIERDLTMAKNAVFTLLEIGNALAFEQAIRIILKQNALSSDHVDDIVEYIVFTKDSNERKKFAAYIREQVNKYADQTSMLMRAVEGLEKP